MKVIFIKDLKNQGKINDIKEVSDGYATNYLIKNGYAVKYTKGSLDRLNKKLNDDKLKDEYNRDEAIKLKEKLEKERLIFNMNTGVNGKVFGNISTKQISEQLKEKGYDIDKKNIKIDGNLNTIGIHQIQIEIYKNISANISIELKEK